MTKYRTTANARRRRRTMSSELVQRYGRLVRVERPRDVRGRVSEDRGEVVLMVRVVPDHPRRANPLKLDVGRRRPQADRIQGRREQDALARWGKRPARRTSAPTPSAGASARRLRGEGRRPARCRSPSREVAPWRRRPRRSGTGPSPAPARGTRPQSGAAARHGRTGTGLERQKRGERRSSRNLRPVEHGRDRGRQVQGMVRATVRVLREAVEVVARVRDRRRDPLDDLTPRQRSG